jgi:dTDP-glucose 4,6-dehydratase
VRLLVTGGAGFIGSAVVRQALAAGHHVTTLDALTYAASPDTLAVVQDHPRHRFLHVDLQDRAQTLEAIADAAPDAVVHAAAESHVDRSIDTPHRTVATNVLGTQHLLDAVRACWGPHPPSEARLVVVSTDEVYGVSTDAPFDESSPHRPRNPYAASKSAADQLALAAFHTWGLPVVVTHGANTYGPYQFPEKLVPVMVVAALEGGPLPLYGDGSPIREWLHVDDHAAGLLAALRGRPGRRYNLGGGERITNLALVRHLASCLDRLRPDDAPHARRITFVADRPGHDVAYALDARRAAVELGWRPVRPLLDGLDATVDWYATHESWWRPLLARHPVGTRLGRA